MRPVFLLVLASLLQTALCAADDREHVPLETALSVSFPDASFASTGHEEPSWRLPRRGLTASSSKSCTWNQNSSTCDASHEVTADVLSSSKKGLAKLWRHLKECLAFGTNEKKCNAMTECGWNWLTETCEFVDYLGQYPDSPCVAHAPLTFSYTRLFLQCRSRTTSRSCRKLDGCAWSGVHDLCYADQYHIYFGVESRDAFTENFLFADQFKIASSLAVVAPGFTKPKMKESDWKEILSIKVPKSDCPVGQDELVCDYVDAHLPHMFPQHAYCLLRYQESTPGTCNDDSLCRHNSRQGCVHRHEIMIESLEKADKVLLDLVPEKTDKHLAREFLRCDRIAKEADCTKNCRWVRNTCVLSRTYTDEEFLKNAKKNSKDPVCQYFRMQLDSGCLDVESVKTCLKNENCGWDVAEQECTVSDNEIRNAVALEEPKLEKPLNKAAEKCQPQKNARACDKS